MLQHSRLTSLLIAWAATLTTAAHARPEAARLVCQAWSDAPACNADERQGAVSCSFCHAEKVPERNPFGVAFKQWFTNQNLPFPMTAEDMRDALDGIAGLDSDGDGISNGVEIQKGDAPGLLAAAAPACGSKNCVYDYEYAYKRIRLSVCGEPPDFEDFETFQRLPTTLAKDEVLARLLDDCMDSNAWRGKDGVIWEIGHYKIRPIGNLKLGEDEIPASRGGVPAVDYYRDYNIFVYSQIDDNDARYMLLAQDAVIRTDALKGGETTYVKQDETQRLEEKMVMQREYRVGLLTSFWNLAVYLNYTGIARVLVAQAFNSFLGISLAEMQGLEHEVSPELTKFKDYDSKLSDGEGKLREDCARCHRTIDPLSYPFRNYNGLTGTTKITNGEKAPLLKDTSKLGDKENLTPLSYALPRMDYLNERYPGINKMPETGYIFGQRVNNLREWATVLVNSDTFASNLVKDYWSAVLGHDPDPRDPEFVMLWRNFKYQHEYRVAKMMHDMIKTKAFGGRPIAQP